MNRTVMKQLTDALTKAAAGNSHAAVPASAVLWTDKERQWEPAIERLQQTLPQLLALGPYAPERHTGPAIWLKCAIARTLGKVPLGVVPVVYLPGVSRTDLRAIETCPRDLQPLAELQYRGVFWSQANGKDWTLSAFLSSKNGGLGLTVASDKATQEALSQTLEVGGLLERTLADLKERQVDAEWLHSLIAPNPMRDLLVWMNDPDAAKQQWAGARWDVFVKRCKSDFGVDPLADVVLAAAELLTKGAGKWAAVSELYRDSYTSFPKVFDLLAKVQPPQLGLFPDLERLSGYPQANEEREAALRYALSACAEMDASQARTAILNAEKEHAVRRNWLWSRMGLSPLATALGHLARVAELSVLLPSGTEPAPLASSYQQTGWQVDDAAIQALASVQAKADVEAVSTALRAVYLPWVEEAAHRLQQAVKGVGRLPPLSNVDELDTSIPGLCTIFVDGLRYDVAVHLKLRLEKLGKTTMSARWTSMPSVTASGKAWCSPVAKLIAGEKDDVDFEPRVASDGKSLSGYNFRKLLTENGVQYLDKHEMGDPQGRAWTECGDLDHYGHEHGLRLARDLNNQLDQVMERVSELSQAGWRRFRIVTDHGWLLVPGKLPKTELPKYQAETRWGRCAVLKETAYGTPLTFGWDWCKDVQVAYAPGVTCFVAGAEYAHGGISLQECLVPVLNLEVSGDLAPSANIAIKAVIWKGLRCVVEVESAAAGLAVDIRTKPALPSTSLVARTKPVESGKASLAVADDEQMGSAAIVVVLGLSGEVLQKVVTTVGG